MKWNHCREVGSDSAELDPDERTEQINVVEMIELQTMDAKYDDSIRYGASIVLKKQRKG